MEYTAKVADREKQSQLIELHALLGEAGQRLEKCLIRLSAIGNRLSDDSGQPVSSIESKPEPQRQPGLVSDLYRDEEGFRVLISKTETQLSKIEKMI